MKHPKNQAKIRERIIENREQRRYCYLLLFICYLFTVPCSLLTGLDFNLRPKGFVSLPLGAGNEAASGSARYSTGGGAELGFEVDLATIWPNPLGLGYNLGLEGGMQISPMLGDDPSNVSYYTFGGAAGLYFFPLSRLFTRIDGAVGAYLSARDTGSSSGRSPAGLFWRNIPGLSTLGFDIAIWDFSTV